MTGDAQPPPPPPDDAQDNAPTTPEIPEGTSDADRAAIEARYAAPYYCAGCGRPFQYPGECTGTGEGPHPPIQTVSTDELSGDPEKFSAAPPTGN